MDFKDIFFFFFLSRFDEQGSKESLGLLKSLNKDILNSKTTVVIDGGFEIYLWFGRNTTNESKKVAEDFVKVSNFLMKQLSTQKQQQPQKKN